MKSRFRTTLSLLLAMSMIAACGGGNGQASDPTTTTAAGQSATTNPTATTQDSGSEPDQSGGPGLPSLSCINTAQAFAAALGGYANIFGGMDADDAQELAEALADAARSVPDQIRDDFAIVAEVMGVFYTAISEMGLEPGATPTPAQMAQIAELADDMDEDRFEDASSRIDDWFDENCD